MLCERVGANVFLKPEILQRTGSFKFRGAFNKLSSIPQAARKGGVVAFSSGNHAQGVAAAAKFLNMPATIVMPADSPRLKRERTESYGAEVVLYDRDSEDREAIASEIAGPRGATLVPPYDDPMVIAGQGTVGREICEDLAALGITPDIVVAPVSGGGLIAGVATAVKARFPQAMVMSAEPEAFRRSRPLAARRQARGAQGRGPHHLRRADGGDPRRDHLCHQRQAARRRASPHRTPKSAAAVAFAFRELKLVVEPGGAVGLAALLAGHIDAKGKTVVIVLSGGNVDSDLYARLIG